MKTELKMTVMEADKYALMKQIESKKTNITGASRVMGVSYRHARRIWYRYQREGPKGLISKRKGKLGNNRIATNVKERAMALINEKYSDYLYLYVVVSIFSQSQQRGLFNLGSLSRWSFRQKTIFRKDLLST